MGAPKATDTPAAAAADNISRFFASFRPYFGKRYDRMLPRDSHNTLMSLFLKTVNVYLDDDRYGHGNRLFSVNISVLSI